jgi:hypothetical protein
MSIPWHNNPEDEGDHPWDDDEGDWAEDDDLEPPWVSPREEADDWQAAEIEEGQSESPYGDFGEIPAWLATHQLFVYVAQVIRLGDGCAEATSALRQLRRQAYLAAVDIAYGHEVGYGPEQYAGHVKHCRRAMERLHRCLELTEPLWDTELLTQQDRQYLFGLIIRSRDVLVHWIEQLREMYE